MTHKTLLNRQRFRRFKLIKTRRAGVSKKRNVPAASLPLSKQQNYLFDQFEPFLSFILVTLIFIAVTLLAWFLIDAFDLGPAIRSYCHFLEDWGLNSANKSGDSDHAPSAGSSRVISPEDEEIKKWKKFDAISYTVSGYIYAFIANMILIMMGIFFYEELVKGGEGANSKRWKSVND